MLTNLSQLTKEQIVEAFTNAGYLDTEVLTAEYRGRSVTRGVDGSFMYRCTYNGEDGVEPFTAYVIVRNDGMIIADF